jgi:hypothetical protein
MRDIKPDAPSPEIAAGAPRATARGTVPPRSLAARECHPDTHCPTCLVRLVPEHTHAKCPRCGYRDSCCF